MIEDEHRAGQLLEQALELVEEAFILTRPLHVEMENEMWARYRAGLRGLPDGVLDALWERTGAGAVRQAVHRIESICEEIDGA